MVIVGGLEKVLAWIVSVDNSSGLSVDFEDSEGDRIAAIVCRERILAVEAPTALCPARIKV